MCTWVVRRVKGREKRLQRICRIVSARRTLNRLGGLAHRVYAFHARTLSSLHAHAPQLQLSPQHTQHRTHVNRLTRTNAITCLNIRQALNERHRNTIRPTHHVSRIHNQQQVTHRQHIRVTVRPHGISERRARIAQNHTTRLSVIELRRRKRIPRIMTPPSHIRHTRRLLTITEHVTRQPVTLVRNRARMKHTRIRHANKTINKTNTNRQDRTLHKKIEQKQTGNKRADGRTPAVSGKLRLRAARATIPIETHATRERTSSNAASHASTQAANKTRTTSASEHKRTTARPTRGKRPATRQTVAATTSDTSRQSPPRPT